MKKLTVTLTFLLFAFWSFAQTIKISEAPRAKDNGIYNSFLFELADVDKKTLEEKWVKFIKGFKVKTKRDKKKKLWFSDNVKMPRLSDGTVDIYARFLENSDQNKRTSVTVWFDLGSQYVNSESDSLKGVYAHEILTEFAMQTSKQHAETIVQKEEKQLAKLEKDLKKLKKANKDYHSTIEKAKNTITKNEKNIEINELDQKNKTKEIEAQIEQLKLAKENVSKFNK